MGNISGNPKSLRAIFSEDDGKNGYLIPSYQRPYSWTEDECERLWDDLVSYALPDPDDFQKFDENGTPYFLGTMVVFSKDQAGGRLEIIDGQQRLTSISLLLRAFLTALDYGEGRPIGRHRHCTCFNDHHLELLFEDKTVSRLGLRRW